MSTEATTEATSTEATTEAVETPGTETAPDLTAEVEKWKAQSRKHEDRAKANAAAAKELEAVRAANMTETEQAVLAAKAEGRQSALGEVGGRLAAAEIKVAAAGRLDPDQVSTLLDGLNLTAFLTEDGEVDSERVFSFVEGIAPKVAEPTETTGLAQFDLGQGARDQSQALGSDPMLNMLKGTLGIK